MLLESFNLSFVPVYQLDLILCGSLTLLAQLVLELADMGLECFQFRVLRSALLVENVDDGL
jgi:hypothetical protein